MSRFQPAVPDFHPRLADRFLPTSADIGLFPPIPTTKVGPYLTKVVRFRPTLGCTSPISGSARPTSGCIRPNMGRCQAGDELGSLGPMSAKLVPTSTEYVGAASGQIRAVCGQSLAVFSHQAMFDPGRGGTAGADVSRAPYPFCCMLLRLRPMYSASRRPKRGATQRSISMFAGVATDPPFLDPGWATGRPRSDHRSTRASSGAMSHRAQPAALDSGTARRDVSRQLFGSGEGVAGGRSEGSPGGGL